MKQLGSLLDRIIGRINVNLRDFEFDAAAFIRGILPLKRLVQLNAFLGITHQHPIHFNFNSSSLAGSYFLGKCMVDHAVLYKSDVRGDELKAKGDRFKFQGAEIPVHDDEVIRIRDAILVKTLVHCYSHDPEFLEELCIQNTVSMPYANIHGSSIEGCFLGPFCTVDLTTLHDSVIGAFSYVQVGELSHYRVKPGTVWIKAGDDFEFHYAFSPKVLKKYIAEGSDNRPGGLLMDFMDTRKNDFQKIFDVLPYKSPLSVPRNASLNRYALVKGQNHIGENVLVVQRAHLGNAWLGKGANVQENCYIINSRLEGNNVTAHGAKIVHAKLGKNVFVGFNSFLRGKSESSLEIGEQCIVMPHTIIDLDEPLIIPAQHLVWGHIKDAKDLEEHTVSIKELSKVKNKFTLKAMTFQGSGSKFIQAFKHRIEHILEANGAFYDGRNNKGHAQKKQYISYHIVQPYRKGPKKGFYPSIEIRS